ncbi:MAG: AAA family ATPase [Myxococcota bacterium]
MWLESIEIVGFGGLEGRYTLARGLSVVHGPNEAGKSTLAAALLAGLCGRVRRRGRAFDAWERYRPWSGGPWRVRLVVRLDVGGRFELCQDLDEPSRSKVVDLELGRDRTSELLVDRAPDGSLWLELDRSVVVKTLVVRQGELAGVRETPDDMQSMLQRAATRGAPDATANEALARIELFRKEHVGSEHASSTKPLKRATDAERDARRALEAAQAAQADDTDLALRARHFLTVAECLRRDRDSARAAAARRERLSLESRLGGIAAIDQRLEALADSEPTVAIATLDDLTTTLAGVRERLPPEPLCPPDSAAIARELAAVPAEPAGDVEPHPTVLAALREQAVAVEALRRHRASAPQEPRAVPTTLEPHALRGLASVLDAPLPLPPTVRALAVESPPVWPWFGVLVGCVAAGAGVGVMAWWLALAGVALAVACVMWALRGRRRRRPGASNAAAEAGWRRHEADLEHDQERRVEARRVLSSGGVGVDSTSARDAASHLEAWADECRVWQAWVADDARLEGAARAADAALGHALRSRGAEAVADYEEACRARAAVARAAGRRPDLERLLAARKRVEGEHEQRAEACREARRRMGIALASAGLPDWDETPAGLASIATWLDEERQRHARALQRTALLEQRAAYLGGASAEALAAELEALPPTDPSAPAAPSQSLACIEEELGECERQAARLQGELAARREGEPSIAESEEALARARAELDRLRRLDRTLDLAARYLSEARDAVHRDIAPRLAARLTAAVPRLTAGHYREARVSADTLEVSVRDAEGHWRDASALSFGASDQLYLALRVVLAQALTKPQESAPLLFDDITAHADPERRDAMLAWLAALSERHQVVLFTSDPAVVSWAESQSATLLDLGRARPGSP